MRTLLVTILDNRESHNLARDFQPVTGLLLTIFALPSEIKSQQLVILSLSIAAL